MSTTAVVVTCFELGAFLADAVDSVLRQTRPVDELVIVDDGSTDAITTRALDECVARGLCVVRTPHRGVAAARNAGINLTAADQVVLLDGDDLFEADLVEAMAGTLDARPDLAFVTCAVQAFGNASYTWIPPACTARSALARGGPHVSSMFRRRAWQIAGPFAPQLEGYEDTDFWVRLMTAGFTGCVLDRPLLNYRVRKNSRYSHAIRSDTFIRTRERLHTSYTLAMAPSERHELLVDTFQFVAEQHAHAQDLAGRARRHAVEADRLLGEIARRRSDVRGLRADPDWGDFKGAAPISAFWGFDRGTPVDRFFIESFLSRHAPDIRGHVVEVKDDGYTRRLGHHLTCVDVIDVDAGNPHATIVVDLTHPSEVPKGVADCFILTQTLHLLFDIKGAIASAARLLKPGGVLLCTIPCLSRLEAGTEQDGSDWWRLTPSAVEELFWQAFPSGQVQVSPVGNLKTCAAFLQGLATEELSAEDLDAHDPAYPLLCTVRAVAAPESPVRRYTPEHADGAGVVLLYHRIGSFSPDVHAIARNLESFIADIEWLSQTCRVMPLADLVDRAREGNLPHRAVSLTFDDGYVEHAETIGPLLARHGLPATFFVNTALLEEPGEQWWDEVERIFLVEGTARGPLVVEGLDSLALDVAEARGRRLAHDRVFSLMYAQTAQQRSRTMSQLRAWRGGAPNPRTAYTVSTAAQLRSLADLPGITIGAHSVNHLAMPLHGREIQLFEAVSCRRTLEKLLQRQVNAFAYPYGAHDAATMDVVREAGYRLAVTVEPGATRASSLPLRVPRVDVGGRPSARDAVLGVLAERADSDGQSTD